MHAHIHEGYSFQTVSDVRSIATQNAIKVLWSGPCPYFGHEYCAFVYQVKYTIGKVTAVKRTFETEFVLSDIPPFTFVLFAIKVQDMGTLGPETILGQTSGLEISYYNLLFILLIVGSYQLQYMS